VKVTTITKTVKFVTDSNGEKIEVLLPYKVYQELLELKISMEIYENNETKKSIKYAENDIKRGDYKKFKSTKKMIKWLKEK
jgi:hypothetical protein